MASTSTSTSMAAEKDAQYRKLIHATALGAVIVCPLVMALPPRKVDFYTLALIAGTAIGGNQLIREYTGRSLVDRMKIQASKFSGLELPSDRAREISARLKEEMLARKEGRPYISSGAAIGENGDARSQGATSSAIIAARQAKADEEEKARQRTVLEKIWMGSEPDDWKAKRDEREKEALEEGRGYGGLIMDQIWEVWNWGKDKTEEIKKKDEEIVAGKKQNESKGN